MSSLLQIVFPDRCLSCDRVVSTPRLRDVCHRCVISIVPIDRDSCPRCSLPGRDDGLCVGCLLDPMPLEKISAVYEYGGAVAEATRRAKERGDIAAWRSVVEWSRAPLEMELARLSRVGFSIVPVPSSRKVAQKRGFELPSLALRWLGFSGRHCLANRGKGSKQSGLSAPTRLDNARASFRLTRPGLQKVCLFDDVVTTGSTMRALAELFIGSGATDVVAVTVARTPRK